MIIEDGGISPCSQFLSPDFQALIISVKYVRENHTVCARS